jgi:hypothetical protein
MTLKGVIRGKTIELETGSDLPDGQLVSVTVHPAPQPLPPGEGLRRAFGAWAGEGKELDEFLEQIRVDRKYSRPEPE